MISRYVLLILCVLASPSFASDISCSLRGSNKISYDGNAYTEALDAILSLEIIKTDLGLAVSEYSIQITAGELIYFIELTAPAEIEISDRWIRITEKEAKTRIINSTLAGFARSIVVNRYSGDAVVMVGIGELLETSPDITTYKTQDAVLRGECKITDQRRF